MIRYLQNEHYHLINAVQKWIIVALHAGLYFTLTYFPWLEKNKLILYSHVQQIISSFFTVTRMGGFGWSMNHIPPLKAPIMLMKLKMQKSANAIFIFTVNTSSPTASKSMFRSFSQIITISPTLLYLMVIFYSIMYNSFMRNYLEIRATCFIRLLC